MGFLERMKREIEEGKRKQDSLQQYRNMSWELRNAERVGEYDEKFRTSVNLSKKYLENSNFPQLCRDLRSIIGTPEYRWEIGKEANKVPQMKKVHPRNDSVCLMLDLGSDTSGGWTTSKYIVIEARSEGTIVVHGGLFGSTKLSLSNWQNNPEIQEKALEKAYNSPIAEMYLK